MNQHLFHLILNKNLRLLFMVCLATINIATQAQNTPNISPEPFPIPLDNTKQLSYLNPVLNQTTITDSNLIIVYGFTSCKPCEVLQKRLQQKIQRGLIADTSIAYVNIFVPDTNTLISQLKSKKITFPYYMTASPYMGSITGGFPLITAYSKGIKKWSVFGYSPSNNRKIYDYLKIE